MQFDYAYRNQSSVTNTADKSGMSFSPDLSREPTFFRGEVAQSLGFREAMSALHRVVVSDLRFKPKDREEYKKWLAENEDKLMAEMLAQEGDLKTQVDSLSTELSRLQRQSYKRMKPYYDAQRKYFDYLYKRDMDAWYVLDPVITVHPDQVFFECFSQDESMYGCLSASFDVFKNVGEFACGTTNVDYSEKLYLEFQKIRTYKTTQLEIDPTGFQVDVQNEPSYKEVKIDLPDTWVRGFLQVSSAMTFPAQQVEFHPFDIHNLCFVLRRKREILGPRSIRLILKPGEPVVARIDPWDLEVRCPRSIYHGSSEQEVRLWGRRRLHVLERLIPYARKFTVFLLGTGMPSFWQADLGDMTFTLGLSGWTANDWSGAGNFDLLAPRREVDAGTAQRVFDALKQQHFARADQLAKNLNLDESVVLGGLQTFTQAGRVIYDLKKGVYRCRELSRDPIPVETLRFNNPREEEAAKLVDANRVTLEGIDSIGQEAQVRGRVSELNNRYERDAVLLIDRDDRLTQARCTCNFFEQNRLRKGPCEHMLALRAVFERQRRERFAPKGGAIQN